MLSGIVLWACDPSGARRRIAGWPVAPPILLLAFLVTAIGCAREAPEEQSGPTERLPRQVLENFSLRNTSAKGLLWILEAAEGVSYGQGEPTRLRDMRVRFFDGGDAVRSTLTSRRGEIDEATNTLVAEDSVVVATPAGERLETESLRWDPSAEKITTEAFFRLTKGGDVLTGVGLTADPDLVRYQVKRDVRATVRDQDERRILEELDGGADGGD